MYEYCLLSIFFANPHSKFIVYLPYHLFHNERIPACIIWSSYCSLSLELPHLTAYDYEIRVDCCESMASSIVVSQRLIIM